MRSDQRRRMSSARAGVSMVTAPLPTMAPHFFLSDWRNFSWSSVGQPLRADLVRPVARQQVDAQLVL
eukprot:4100904-Alexandrium_andersonii.AAC.1